MADVSELQGMGRGTMRGLVERWWPMGRYSFQAEVIHGVQVIPVIPSPTEDAIDLAHLRLRPKTHGAVAAPSPPVFSRLDVSILSLAPRSHHELATSDVRQPQGEGSSSISPLASSPLLLRRCVIVSASECRYLPGAWCCLCSRAGTCPSFSQVKLEPV